MRPDASINLLDYGCIRVFDSKFVRGVIDLYHALQNDDRALAVHAYETWGFSGLTNEVLDTLNLWAYFVYDPILDDRTRKIQESPEGGVYGAKVASKVHRELDRLGGVRPPQEFVYMDRAAIGLGSVFLHLKAEVNWHALFEELIAGFDETACAAARPPCSRRRTCPRRGRYYQIPPFSHRRDRAGARSAPRPNANVNCPLHLRLDGLSDKI